jgi:hypothetical protein
MKILKLTLAAALLVAPTLAQATTWRCTTTEKWQCSPGKGQCIALDPKTVWAKVDFTGQTYQRCDAKKPCDTYPMTIETLGNYTHINIPSRGMMVKVEVSTAKFVEVVSLMLDTLISFGTCAPE